MRERKAGENGQEMISKQQSHCRCLGVNRTIGVHSSAIASATWSARLALGSFWSFCPSSEDHCLFISLVLDLINVHKATEGQPPKRPSTLNTWRLLKKLFGAWQLLDRYIRLTMFVPYSREKIAISGPQLVCRRMGCLKRTCLQDAWKSNFEINSFFLTRQIASSSKEPVNFLAWKCLSLCLVSISQNHL